MTDKTLQLLQRKTLLEAQLADVNKKLDVEDPPPPPPVIDYGSYLIPMSRIIRRRNLRENDWDE